MRFKKQAKNILITIIGLLPLCYAVADVNVGQEIYVMQLDHYGYYIHNPSLDPIPIDKLASDYQDKILEQANQPLKKALLQKLDSKKDKKVVDTMMAKKQTYRVFFGFDKSNLDKEDRKIISKFVYEQVNLADKNNRIVLVGRTDSVGSNAYNQRLSRKRTQSVANFIINHFHVQATRIYSYAYGEDKPIQPKSNHALNRSVTMLILSNDEVTTSQSQRRQK